MTDGYTKKYNPTYIKQTLVLVGILNGIGHSLVNLPNTRKVNFTIGIVTHTKNLITNLIMLTHMVN